MLSAEHQQQKEQSEVAFINAKNTYETGVKNQLTQYEQQMKEREALMPKIQHDVNGISIQQFDPNTGKVNVQFHNTKTVLDQADKMKPLLEGLGLPGPAAEAEEAKFVLSTYAHSPILAQEALKQLAVKRTLSAGAGQQVFGPTYEAAMKTATKQLQAEAPTMISKPDEYLKELNNRASAIILSDPKIHNMTWAKTAAPHSVAARLLSGVASGE